MLETPEGVSDPGPVLPVSYPVVTVLRFRPFSVSVESKGACRVTGLGWRTTVDEVLLSVVVAGP